MVACSKFNKKTCPDADCIWVPKRGCVNPKNAEKPAKEAKTNPKEETKTKTKPKPQNGGPMDGMNIVFSGFRDEALKKAVQSQGGKVVSTVSGKTTHFVYVATAKNKEKIAALTGPRKLKLETFVKKFNLPLPDIKPQVKKKTEPKTKKTPIDWRTRFVKSKSVVTYQNVELKSMLRQARAIAYKLFKPSKIREIYEDSFYVPSTDRFIIIARIGTQNAKNNMMNDFIGIEFRFDTQHRFSDEATLFVSNRKANEYNQEDIIKVVKTNFPDAVHALTI